MSAAIGAFIASAFSELVASIIHKKTGKSPEDSPDLKLIAESAVREAMESGMRRLEMALQERLSAIGLEFEIRELATVLEGVDEWFKPKGGIPRILDGVEMTEMPPDWHPPKDGEGG